jgi:hypothetical protein
MNLRRIGVGVALVLSLGISIACDRSPTQAAPARRPTTRGGGGGTPRQLAVTTQPAGKTTFDAVDLKAPPEIVVQLVERMGFDPFGECAVQLRDLGGRPKLAVVGPAKIRDGAYTVDVEEMTQSRTSTQREFGGWINFKNAEDLEEWRVFINAKWDQAATTAPTATQARMDAPTAVSIAWVGPKITEQSANRLKRPATRPVVTPDRTRPPASNAAPAPST